MRCRPCLILSYTATSISLAQILYQSRMIIFATVASSCNLCGASDPEQDRGSYILWLSNDGPPPEVCPSEGTGTLLEPLVPRMSFVLSSFRIATTASKPST
jgi:hypothetical protein